MPIEGFALRGEGQARLGAGPLQPRRGELVVLDRDQNVAQAARCGEVSIHPPSQPDRGHRDGATAVTRRGQQMGSSGPRCKLADRNRTRAVGTGDAGLSHLLRPVSAAVPPAAGSSPSRRATCTASHTVSPAPSVATVGVNTVFAATNSGNDRECSIHSVTAAFTP